MDQEKKLLHVEAAQSQLHHVAHAVSLAFVIKV